MGKRKINTYLIIFWSFTVSILFAEKVDIKLTMDYARFNYDSVSVYIEVYYSAYLERIDQIKNITQWPYSSIVDFEVLRADTNMVLAKEKVNLTFKKSDSLAIGATTGTMGMMKLILPEGKYIFRMINNQDTVRQNISIDLFKSSHITMSDIQFCTNIITNYHQLNDPYYKNTMEVMPNPTLLYGKVLPVLYYYLELYNLLNDSIKVNSQLNIQAVIADTDGHVRLKKNYRKRRSSDSSVEIGTFNISKLESGLYTLIFAVTDSIKDEVIYRQREFYVYNPDIILVATDQASAPGSEIQFMSMMESELDEKFAQAGYLMTQSENQVYKLLNSVESKREFLVQFWRTRNKQNPEFQEQYYERVDVAMDKFGVSNLKGWQTDMGRVYILYGTPDENEKYPSNIGENPYEIWYYHNIEGGVEFDFVDITGYGIYQLVNSTKRGEVQYGNWRQEYVISQ